MQTAGNKGQQLGQNLHACRATDESDKKRLLPDEMMSVPLVNQFNKLPIASHHNKHCLNRTTTATQDHEMNYSSSKVEQQY